MTQNLQYFSVGYRPLRCHYLVLYTGILVCRSIYYHIYLVGSPPSGFIPTRRGWDSLVIPLGIFSVSLSTPLTKSCRVCLDIVNAAWTHSVSLNSEISASTTTPLSLSKPGCAYRTCGEMSQRCGGDHPPCVSVTALNSSRGVRLLWPRIQTAMVSWLVNDKSEIAGISM